MKILIFNWRDIKNPQGGGAELLTHEIAKYLYAHKHEVTQFSPLFPGAKKNEIVDGVKYIRNGTWWNIHLLAFFYYMRGKFGDPDIIIDEVHWFPFFTAIYARKKTVLLACEIANSLFFTLFPYPISVFFRVIEDMYLLLYRNIPTLVISPSTYKDFIEKKHNPKKLTIIPMGFTHPAQLKEEKKEKNPTIIYLARINKQKGIYDALVAFSIIKKSIPLASLWIVGSGSNEIVQELKQKIKNMHIQPSVTFFGFVSEKKKFELLARAHVLIIPSVKEGWGLTIPEASLVKTVSVSYLSHGLKDIVKNNKTGILVEQNPGRLAEGIVGILLDKSKYKQLQESAYKDIRKYSWENTGKATEDFLKQL